MGKKRVNHPIKGLIHFFCVIVSKILLTKIENCINCGKCKRKCPYELDTPELLRKNLEDYKNVLAGKVQV